MYFYVGSYQERDSRVGRNLPITHPKEYGTSIMRFRKTTLMGTFK